jgi:acetyltransferase
MKPNGLHRAEVVKVLVHSRARRRGVGRALMLELERLAHVYRRSTLVLDTREGDPSNSLYQSLGYTLLGVIPAYCKSENGQLDGSGFYYKLL